MQEIIIATKNKGKANEFKNMFYPLGYEIRTLLDFPQISEIDETGTTFEANAKLKAEAISNILGEMVIADDSGLMIDALDGRPGVYSARYAGLEKDDDANMDKVLQELKDIPISERTARFYCALALAVPNKETLIVHGTCEGEILTEKRGENGFGYDPIFFVTEKGKGMAELLPEEKNQISHRAEALKKMSVEFESYLKKDKKMKILIVSDSHGLQKELQEIKKRHQHEVDLFIHCGDSELNIDDLSLEGYVTVRGNCDFNAPFPEEVLKEFSGKKIFVTHGHHYSVKSSLQKLLYRAKEKNANIVCFGHSHLLGAEFIENILFINPGSLRLPRSRQEKTYCILTIGDENYSLEVYNYDSGVLTELSFHF